MCTAIPQIFSGMILASRDEKALLFRMEGEQLGFTHAEVGGRLLEKWRIPASIAEPVACHHSPATARKFPLEAAFIHLADIICKSQGLGFNGEWFIPPLEPASWERLEIPPASLPEIVRHVESQMAETMAILGGCAP
jgi:hypothetical protein